MAELAGELGPFVDFGKKPREVRFLPKLLEAAVEGEVEIVEVEPEAVQLPAAPRRTPRTAWLD